MSTDLLEYAYDVTRAAYPKLNIPARIPERPIEPPEPRESSIDLAIKRLKTSLTALEKSEYWIAFRENISDNLNNATIDQIAKSCMDNDAFELKRLCDVTLEKAIRATADQNIDELGVVL